MKTWVWSLASLSELRIRGCHELWCRPAASALICPQPGNPHTLQVQPKKDEKKKKRLIRPSIWSCWKEGCHMYCGWEGDSMHPLLESTLVAPIAILLWAPLDPGIPQLGIYPNPCICIQRGMPNVTCHSPISNNQEQPKSPTEEKLNDTVHLTMKYYVAGKKNAVHSYVQKWKGFQSRKV